MGGGGRARVELGRWWSEGEVAEVVKGFLQY